MPGASSAYAPERARRVGLVAAAPVAACSAPIAVAMLTRRSLVVVQVGGAVRRVVGAVEPEGVPGGPRDAHLVAERERGAADEVLREHPDRAEPGQVHLVLGADAGERHVRHPAG